MGKRLTEELRLLYKAEAVYKIPAASVIRQLLEYEDCPLSDVLPLKPAWIAFEWPVSGVVDFVAYWRNVDHGRRADWTGPYL